MRVRLVRAVSEPWGNGPGNGQYALQRALLAHPDRPDWFSIGNDDTEPGVLPWYWCWLDRRRAVRCAVDGRPFVIGPNMLWANLTRACAAPGEKLLCHASSCRLQFTESAWYRDWIRAHLGPANRGPIVLWPYPIDPEPGPPIDPPAYDLLIYAKHAAYHPPTVAALLDRWPRSILFRYSASRRYRRADLIAAARAARACVYLSDNDRGPLALAEILLTGCPAVGIERGAPWCTDGRLGVVVEQLDAETLLEAVDFLRLFDREKVRQIAKATFDALAIGRTVFRSLDQARRV